jgi:hypothetical protein
MRKVLAVLTAATVIGVMALAGPAGAAPKPPKPPPKESKCTSKSQKAITFSMDAFLNPAAGGARATYIQNGDKISSILDTTFQAAKTAGLLKFSTISAGLTSKCTGKTMASFTYDLRYLDATTGTTQPPLGLHNAGGAVLVKGKWLITPQTVCDLLSLIGMVIPGATYGQQCYQAAGLPVPPPS